MKMNFINLMIIFFYNFFFEILYVALVCCENWDKIMFFGCVIKNKLICLYIVFFVFYNIICLCIFVVVILFSIILFKICSIVYIIDIKKVNIFYL